MTWTRLPVVNDALVSPSSAVADMRGGVSSDSDGDVAEPQAFSFSEERSFVCAETQGEMSYEGSPVQAPPSTRRRVMPPTPQHISHSSTNESQWQADLEAQQSIWSTRERKVMAGMENYLDEGADMKVEIEALELLIGPEDSEVCLRYILTHARRRGAGFSRFSAPKREN